MFEIDLKRVLQHSPDSLQSRANLRSIMKDLYPDKVREINVLLSIYESGIPREIRNKGDINDLQYSRYVQRICDDYGMQEQYVADGLILWVSASLGHEVADKLKYNSFDRNNGVVAATTSTAVSSPIVHKAIDGGAQIPAVGKTADYETIGLSNGKYTIAKFLGFETDDFVIPTNIEGKDVVSVGNGAFKGCKGIKRLIIPEGIEYIGKEAFSGCSNLAEVLLPSTLSTIEEGAFSGTALIRIDMPNGIKTIGSGAFRFCYNLREALFPDNLEEICRSAFYGCRKLESIKFPNSLRKIGYGAFEGCESLQDVVLNEGLAEIESSAFSECNSIKKLCVPMSVVKIGKEAFVKQYFRSSLILCCYPGSYALEYARLNNIKVEQRGATSGSPLPFDTSKVKPIIHSNSAYSRKNDSQASFSQNAFETANRTNGLEITKFLAFGQSDYTIPAVLNGKRVVGIGANAFKGCREIAHLIIEDGIEYIEKEAFSGCTGLTEVHLPSTLSKMGESAFSSTALIRIDMPNGIKSIESGTFMFCHNLKEALLPDKLEEICRNAFYGCAKLESIRFPNSLRKIGYAAFDRCVSLQDVMLNEGLAEIESSAFSECNSIKKLYVPMSVVKIGKEAFVKRFHNSSLVLCCYPSSYALEYARLNGIKVEQA